MQFTCQQKMTMNSSLQKMKISGTFKVFWPENILKLHRYYDNTVYRSRALMYHILIVECVLNVVADLEHLLLCVSEAQIGGG